MAPKLMKETSTRLASRSGSLESRGRSVKPVFHYLHPKEAEPASIITPESACRAGSNSSLKVAFICEYQYKDPSYSLASPPENSRHLMNPPLGRPLLLRKSKEKPPLKKTETQPNTLKYFLNYNSQETPLMRLSKYQELENLGRVARSQTAGSGSLKKRKLSIVTSPTPSRST